MKIVDFGISKSLREDDQHLTKDNHFIGTINYMAPEILLGQPPSPSSDLFSVGIVFFELITGNNPFLGDNKFKTMDNIRNEQVELPEDLTKLIPIELSSILKKLISRNIHERYQSSIEVIKDLENLSKTNLPDFHGVSLRPEIIITNRENIRLRLLKIGYLDSETRILINLAAKLEELNELSQSTEIDKTIDVSIQSNNTEINITDRTIEAAINNFEEFQG